MKLHLTLKRFLAIFIITGMVPLFAISCGNKVLATYDGGEVGEKSLQKAIEILSLGDKELQPEMKKELTKAIALWEVLSKKAIEEGIDKTDRAAMHFDLVKTNLARSVLMSKKQKEIQDSKETVYKARHILLKVDASRAIPGPDGKIEQKQLTDSELVELDKSSYERLATLREDILSGKTKFEDAASQFSQDGSKGKGGDLGYFTKGMMVGSFQVVVEYLADEIEGAPARVLVDNTAIYTEPNLKSTAKEVQKVNSIVLIDETFEDKLWKKVILNNDTGYILNTTVKVLEDSKKVSYPVRSQFGWHIIELTESTKVTKEGLASKLEKSLLADIPKDKKDDTAEKAAEENAKRTADDFWNRVKSVKSMQWQKKAFAKHGIQSDQITLPVNWKSMEILMDTDSLKIKKADVIKQLTNIVNERHMDLNQVLEDDNLIQRFYQDYVMNLVFILIAEEENLYESDEYKDAWEFRKQNTLAELYIRKHWEGDITVPEEEIKAAYENYKKQSKQRMEQTKQKMPIESYKKLKPRISDQLREQKIRMNIEAKRDEFLTSINFKLNDEAFQVK